MTTKPITKPRLKLSGTDGNAFAVLGKARRLARVLGWTAEQWQKLHEDATSGDYDHLFQTLMVHFDVD